MEKYSDLPKIKVQLEELEKRINSLSKTKTSQIEELNTTIVQINQNLQSAQSLIAYLQTNVENNCANIEALQEIVCQTEVLVNQLTSKIEKLENALSSGEFSDVYNYPSILHHTTDTGNYTCDIHTSLETRTKYFFFNCEPDTVLDMEFTVYYTTRVSEEKSADLILKINDETQYQTEITIEPTINKRQIVNFSIKYYPTKKHNNFYFSWNYNSETGNLYKLIAIKTKIVGHNPLFLHKDCFYQVMCYKHKYFITKFEIDYQSDYLRKFVLTNDNREFNYEIGYIIPISDSYFTQRIAYKTDGTFEEIEGRYTAVGHALYTNDYTLYSDFSVVLPSVLPVHSASICSYRNLNTYNDNAGYTAPCCCVICDYCPAYFDNETKYIYLTLNGNPLKKEWIDIVGIYQQDMTDEIYYPFRGCMLLRDDGYYYYFPEVNSTYCVKLGFGKNGTLIKRKGSETLYAYIGGFNRVTQYVLEKASNGIYSVTKTTTKYGLSEYCETQDDLAIIVKGGEIYFVDKMFD